MREIPTLAMLAAPVAALRDRAEAIVRQLESAGITARVERTEAQVGGGSFPDATIPSSAVGIPGRAESLAAALREGDPPVVGRIQEDVLLLDLRTIPAPDDDRLCAAILAATR
jgi:L-seryl-tRNA(Ser) seleniumtransferase